MTYSGDNYGIQHGQEHNRYRGQIQEQDLRLGDGPNPLSRDAIVLDNGGICDKFHSGALASDCDRPRAQEGRICHRFSWASRDTQ